jgi:hypothetical protein
MAWKEAAAQLGTGTLVSGLKALKGTMKKRDFKRLVSTTVAQLLAVHPDLGRRKARRWARKATGARPAKLGKRFLGLKEAVESAGAAALAAGAAKAASKLADRRPARRRSRVARTNGKPKEEQSEAGP